MKMLFVCTLATLCFAAPADAHHSASAVFDVTHEIDVAGVVTSVALRNPHVRIYFSVTGEDGSETEWMAEGGTYSALARIGWSGDDIRPGDAVSIHGNPSRSGLNAILMQTVTLPDGRVINTEEPQPTGGLEAVRARRRAASE